MFTLLAHSQLQNGSNMKWLLAILGYLKNVMSNTKVYGLVS